MAIQVGPLVRKLRERWRMTQQDLVEYTGLDRSASYISSIETGRTSPTLVEMEALARVFRTTLLDMLQEAGATGSTPASAEGASSSVERAAALVSGLGEAGQTLALELLELLAERERRRGG